MTIPLGPVLAVTPWAGLLAVGAWFEWRNWLDRRQKREEAARRAWDELTHRAPSLYADMEPVGEVLLQDDFRLWREAFGYQDADEFAAELADIRALPVAEPRRTLL